MRHRIRAVLVGISLSMLGVLLLALPAHAQYTPPPTVQATVLTTTPPTTPPTTTAPAPKLAFTGSDVFGMVRIAVAVLFLGGGLVILARSRRKHSRSVE